MGDRLPRRTGDKFFKGDPDNYWLWGWGLRYAGLFPNDITYTVGKSDYRKDWFFQEVPHSTTTAWLNPDAKDPYNQRFGWVAIPPTNKDPWSEWGHGRATTWTVKFNMPKSTQGQAILRIALAGPTAATAPRQRPRRTGHRRQWRNRWRDPSSRHQRPPL